MTCSYNLKRFHLCKFDNFRLHLVWVVLITTEIDVFKYIAYAYYGIMCMPIYNLPINL